jgi:hypothetical protein
MALLSNKQRPLSSSKAGTCVAPSKSVNPKQTTLVYKDSHLSEWELGQESLFLDGLGKGKVLGELDVSAGVFRGDQSFLSSEIVRISVEGLRRNKTRLDNDRYIPVGALTPETGMML